MSKPTVMVNFIGEDFSVNGLDSPEWKSASPVAIDRQWNGELAAEHRRTDIRCLWSASALYVRFDARQGEPLFLNENPQTGAKTMELWEHDVCELFLAPDRDDPRFYAEFEIAPTGEWLDLTVDWRKDEPRDWEYKSEMEAFSTIELEMVIMVMKIPWAAFGGQPTAGDTWLGNFYRAVGSSETRGYLAWSPTMTDTPQFHVPENFGQFIFEK
ncbi:MAG: carbohydrate-binding family 9-like protein [Pyrinomonadaceae bacterium]